MIRFLDCLETNLLSIIIKNNIEMVKIFADKFNLIIIFLWLNFSNEILRGKKSSSMFLMNIPKNVL